MKNVYVITGGSGGIGLECAKQYKNDVVFISDINQDAINKGLEELKDLNIECYGNICDITKQEQIETLAKIAKEKGEIKGVVHTAGVSGVNVKCEMVMNVDLIGSENIIEGFLPYMAQGSSMVLVASMMGYVVPANPLYDVLLQNPKQEDFMKNILPFISNNSNNAYNFAKRGVQLLAQKWATEFGEKGIRINSLSPGIIETPMAVEASQAHPEQMQYMKSITPLKRNGKPIDIARGAVFLTSEESSFITGSDLKIDGGLIETLMKQQAKKA